jgi:hypothetical protein
MNKENKRNLLIVGITFVVSYLLIFLLGKFVFKSISSTIINHIFIISFFILGYFLFEILQKEIKFSFSEYYVGIVLLVISYLGFYLAYYFYYRKVVLSSMFSYLISSPYIYVSLGFFAGWLAFMLKENLKK